MEFLVEFEVEVPAGTPDAEVEQHQRAESAAAAKLAEDGHLVRLWRRPLVGDGTTVIGLYRVDSEAAPGGQRGERLGQPRGNCGGVEYCICSAADSGVGSTKASSSAANSSNGLVPEWREAYSAMAAITVHSSRAACRLAAG
jgi:hypothetical protein